MAMMMATGRMLLRGATTTTTTAAWCTQARYTVHARTLRTAALAAIASQQQKQLQYLGKAQFVTSTAAVCNARHPPRRRRRRTKRTLGSRDGILAVDRSSLYPVDDDGEGDGAAQQDGSASSAAAAAASKQNMKNKTPDTPILEDLKAMISLRGPISIAEFMRQALTHPKHGYYMHRDVFGSAGDFVTSPEISQMFGELMGIWVVSTWEQLGSPSKLRLVEMGPGRGNLMANLLRVVRRFPDLHSALTVHMVEVSPAMRLLQKEALDAVEEPEPERENSSDTSDAHPAGAQSARIRDGTAVHWHNLLAEVPSDMPSIMIAHELFDALPVHQFEKTSRGWKERLIDTDTGDGPHHLRLVLSKTPTPALNALLVAHKRGELKMQDASGAQAPPASSATATATAAAASAASTTEATEVSRAGVSFGDSDSDVDSGSDSDGAGGKHTASDSESEIEIDSDLDVDSSDFEDWDGQATAADTSTTDDQGPSLWPMHDAELGTVLEFCPAGLALAYEIGDRIGTSGGAALVCDYGKFHSFGDSIRGIRKHKFVDILLQPGRIDLSADVDLTALGQAASVTGKAKSYKAVTQNEFLQRLGIEARLHQLLANAKDEETQERLVEDVTRLLHPDQMGTIYKFMAIAAADIKEPPIGGFAEVVTPSPGATLPIPKPNDTNPTADS